MNVHLPELSLVMLVGPSGSGKSTFAAKHFRPTEVLSSDECRGLVSDDPNNQAATADAFDVLYYIGAKRLAAGRLTVVDATSVRPEDRKRLVQLARDHDVLAIAIVFNLPIEICQERNRSRSDRDFGPQVVRQQSVALRRSLRGMQREGIRTAAVFTSVEDVESAAVVHEPLWTDRRTDRGPFDVIGDVHGCFDELTDLLTTLGYQVDVSAEQASASHPEGRKVVFLGDLVDRGPASPQVMRLVMSMVESGAAICVPGNHDVKLMRKLRGRDVAVTHGLAETLAQLAGEPPEFSERIVSFTDRLVSHYVLDEGRLVVAHAGMRERYQGRASARVRDFALFGETTGETDEFGLPVRYDWASEYRGRAKVVYGHTPTPEAVWVNGTICLDTGCVFGGKLTALRYPENELVQVDARRQYYEPVKPLHVEDGGTTGRPDGDLLDIGDVSGKRVLETRFHRTVTVREENAAAALEIMSRFAIDPHWLVYLPPTMSPAETAPSGQYLERPEEAFDYFRREDVPSVICEEKHMGSRGVLVVCKDEETARRRFGAQNGEIGTAYTRTGRRFFSDLVWERTVLERLQSALTASGLWERLETEWVCLDAEIMPWSVKAQDLLRRQYAPLGAAAMASLSAAATALRSASERDDGSAALLSPVEERRDAVERYIDAYRRYCWPVESPEDLAIAPFHILASEGHVYIDRDHVWHMQTIQDLCEADTGLLRATPYRMVAIGDTHSEREAIAWWESLTEQGGEGMVVKPLEWITRGKRGLVQPAIKCRGSQYLRIIYGPEYLLPEHLAQLRQRSVAPKRSLALREYALGLEALHRFVEGEPLYRVHECVFGVLALESEPVDPRL